MTDIFDLFQIEKGSTPMPKLDEEALSLIAASHSTLQSLILQSVPVPPRLVMALQDFTKEQLGFQVTFEKLAMLDNPKPEVMPLGMFAADLAHRLANTGTDAAKAIENAEQAAEAIDMRFVLASLGRAELLLESLAAAFGWSRSTLKLGARLDYDHRHKPKH